MFLVHRSNGIVKDKYDLTLGLQLDNAFGPAIYTWKYNTYNEVQGLVNRTRPYVSDDDSLNEYLYVYDINNSSLEPKFVYENKEELLSNSIIKKWYDIGKSFLRGRSFEQIILDPASCVLDNPNECCRTNCNPYSVINIINQCCILSYTWENQNVLNKIIDCYAEAGIVGTDLTDFYDNGEVVVLYNRSIQPLTVIENFKRGK